MTSRRAWLGFLLGLVLLLCPVLAVPAADGQRVTVSYLEGNAFLRVGADWSALSVGDSVPLETSVKLEQFALLQLKAVSATITITEPGTYAIKGLVASSAALHAAGAGTAVATAFSKILHGSVRNAGTAGGVRSEAMEAPVFDLEQGDTGEEALLDIADAYALDGDARSALVSLAAVTPGGTEDWAKDHVLLTARLMEDTFAFSAAIDLLLAHGPELITDESRAQTWLFLLALGYKGTGDSIKEKLCLDKVVEMAPESELAVAAALLREGR